MKNLLIKPISCAIGSVLFIAVSAFAADRSESYRATPSEDPMQDRGVFTSNGPDEAIPYWKKNAKDRRQVHVQANAQPSDANVSASGATGNTSVNTNTNAAAPERADRTNTDHTYSTYSSSDRNYNAKASAASDSAAMKDIPHITISFAQDSAMLSEVDKEKLRELVRDTRSKAAIDNVAVVAWSDKDVPMRGEKLSDADRNLAKSRAEVIQSFLKDEMGFARTDIDTFNMAENANWFARTFRTQDWELKSIFSKKGAKAPVNNNEFMLVREEGGPSLAVVVLQKDKDAMKK
jgi:hypothetical protein